MIGGMDWRGLLVNRFVLVPGAIALAAWGWAIYAGANAGGLVSGMVVRADGGPVAGSLVAISDRNITSNFVERTRARVDESGRFRIDDNRSHMVRVQAIAPDGARSEFRVVRLWFRAQNVDMTEPLTMARPVR
jgi:hypothetical protein